MAQKLGKLAQRENLYFETAYREFRQLMSKRTAEDHKNGLTWYAMANSKMAEIAEEFNTTVETVAYVAAILSPLCVWSANIHDTRNAFDVAYNGASPDFRGALPSNQRKALDFLNFGDRTLKGPKVEPFFLNLLLDESAITVDTWMHRASKVPGKLTAMKVRAIARAVEQIAKNHRIRPYQAQAIIWNVVRREFGYRDSMENASEYLGEDFVTAEAPF